MRLTFAVLLNFNQEYLVPIIETIYNNSNNNNNNLPVYVSRHGHSWAITVDVMQFAY